MILINDTIVVINDNDLAIDDVVDKLLIPAHVLLRLQADYELYTHYRQLPPQ